MIKMKEQKMKEQKMKKESSAIIKKDNNVEDEEVLKFRKEYEKSMKQPVQTKTTIPKSQRGRKKRTPQEIRDDMLKKLEDSNLK